MEVTFQFARCDPSLQIRRIEIALNRHVTLETASLSPAASDDEDIAIPPEDNYSGEPNSPFNHGDNSEVSLLPGEGLPLGSRPSVTKAHFPFRLSSSSSASSPLPSRPTSATTKKEPASASILLLEKDEIVWSGERANVLLSGNIPKDKSAYRYSVGETMTTTFAAVHFTLCVKVCPPVFPLLSVTPPNFTISMHSSSSKPKLVEPKSWISNLVPSKSQGRPAQTVPKPSPRPSEPWLSSTPSCVISTRTIPPLSLTLRSPKSTTTSIRS